MEIIVEGLPEKEAQGYVVLINDIMRVRLGGALKKYSSGDTENFVSLPL